jgi:DNA-binding IclR family transcriptional regulator
MSAIEAYYVTRTMRALELLAFGPLSAPQVAAALQTHPRTARRMLQRLADEEYVVRLDEPRGRYALTMRLVAVAGQALDHMELPRLTAPFVALLHAETMLTAHLVVPSYDRVLCVAHCDGGRIPEPGLRELIPAHCTAGGKALLAERDRWRESLLNRTLNAYTERTVTDPGAVEHEAVATRQRGYAIEDGEYRLGVQAVAAPVRDRGGAAIAAVGVSTTGRMDVERVSGDVMSVAAALSVAVARSAPDRSR